MMDMPIGLMIFTENLFHFLVCPTRGTGPFDCVGELKMAAPFGAAINYALCILNCAFFTALDLQRPEPYRPHYPRTS